MLNRIALVPGVGQKRISLQSFVREPAATGFFPGEIFVEEKDVSATRRQQGARQGARRTASDNRYGVLRTHSGHAFAPKDNGSPAGSKILSPH